MGSVLAGAEPKASWFSMDNARYYSANTTTTYLSAQNYYATFELTQRSSSLVTRNGTFDQFTINRTGIWLVGFGFRFNLQSGTNTTGDFAVNVQISNFARMAEVTVPAPLSGVTSVNRITSRVLYEGDVLRVHLYNLINGTVVRNSDHERSYISLTWLQGL